MICGMTVRLGVVSCSSDLKFFCANIYLIFLLLFKQFVWCKIVKCIGTDFQCFSYWILCFDQDVYLPISKLEVKRVKAKLGGLKELLF